MACNTFLGVLHHIPEAMWECIDEFDYLSLRATCQEANTSYKLFCTKLTLPFTGGEYFSSFVTNNFRGGLTHLSIHSNAIPYMKLDGSRLIVLNLSRCNLTQQRLRHHGHDLCDLLNQSVNLTTLNVSSNALRSWGLTQIMSWIKSSKLANLFLGNCELRYIPKNILKRDMSSLKYLDLSDNHFDNFGNQSEQDLENIVEFLNKFPNLEWLNIDHCDLPIERFLDTHSRLSTLYDLHWRSYSDVNTILSKCPHLIRLGLRCTRTVPNLISIDFKSHSLQHLQSICFISLRLLPREWDTLLHSYATHCHPRSLTLWNTNVKTVVVEKFLTHVKDPKKFISLSLWSLQDLQLQGLKRFCDIMSFRNIQLKCLTLAECDRLVFSEEDASFLIQILDEKMHYELNLRHRHGPLRNEWKFLQHLLQERQNFSCVTLCGQEFKCLEMNCPSWVNVDISYCILDPSLNIQLPQLVTMEMSELLMGGEVDNASHLFSSVLTHSPKLQKLVGNGNTYLDRIQIPPCIYLETLILDYSRMSWEFRSSLLSALESGYMPVLSYLSVIGNESYQHDFTVALIKALGHHRRGCRLDATGFLWNTECKLWFLADALTHACHDALSMIHLSVQTSLSSVVEYMRKNLCDTVEFSVRYA